MEAHLEQCAQLLACRQSGHACLRLLQPERALNRVHAQPTAQDWDDFMDYLHSLPPMPEMEGAKTLSEVYDRAEEAKAAAMAAHTAAVKAAGAGHLTDQTATATELHLADEDDSDAFESE